MTILESNPFANAVKTARLTGRERGVYDAECINSFLGGVGVAGETKHRIYQLQADADVQAHDAFIEVLGLTQPDFDGILAGGLTIEELRPDRQLVRQLIVEDYGRVVCYAAQVL